MGPAQFVGPLLNGGRREDRALAAPASSVCKWVEKNAHGLHRYSRDIPAFPAQWVDGLYVLSPGSGLSCPVTAWALPSSLTPGSRRQDHTISPYAAPGFAKGYAGPTPFAYVALRPSHPVPTCRDDGDTPLWRARMSPLYGKSEFL